ncbi:MAG TPA: Xaa-Pro peptidase family protein [Bryobacteraceae bacterium]|nr:Xaa-Pro peptidase family protein [Bryobacteraceae bacterium]
MRMLLGLLLLIAPVFAGGIPREEYQARRAELRKNLDGVLVLFARADDDLRDYIQEPNFLYFTGWRDPGAALMITAKEEILFLPRRNRTSEIFYGRVIDPGDKDVSEKTGFSTVQPVSSIETTFLRLIETTPKVYGLRGEAQLEKLMALAPLHPEGNATALVAKLREMKSPAELALLQKAADATVAAHLAAWHAMKSGKSEYEISAVMTNTYFSMGCERSAYAPIVGSGPNSVILHYSANKRKMDAGEVVVMDVAAECSDYAMDVTRTVPVSGKFSDRQREIYEIVLGAQKAAIAAIKPGIKAGRGPGTLQQIAFDYINTHGKDVHGQPLGKYFTHGLSHHVGLDVHDPSEPGVELKPGMVITIEPGIYIPEENIGVRIEDTILVTETGCKILSGALPKEVDEIERLVAK